MNRHTSSASTVAWLTAAAALAYLCRNSIGVAESTIRAELQITEEQSGWFMGTFFCTYALFQVPTGWMGAHWGTRAVLAWCAVAWSIGTMGIGLSHSLWMLIASHALMGMAQAGVFPCAVQSISHWFSAAKRASACGWLSTGMQIGATMAAVVSGWLLTHLSWRSLFLVLPLPSLLWMLGFVFSFCNRPAHAPAADYAMPADNVPPSTSDSSTLITIGTVIFLCGQQMFRAAGYSFFASWLPTFVQETRGLSVKGSGWMQGIVFLGALLGCLAGGRVADIVYRQSGSLRLSRSGVGGVCTGLCALLVYFAYGVHDEVAFAGLVSAGAFLAAAAGPVAYSAAIDIGGPRTPTIFGLMNMSGSIAAAVTPVAVGRYFEHSKDWNDILSVFSLLYVGAAICWLFLNSGRRIH